MSTDARGKKFIFRLLMRTPTSRGIPLVVSDRDGRVKRFCFEPRETSEVVMQARSGKYQAVGLALILAATIAPVSFAVSLDSSGAAAEQGRASIASAVSSSRADAS